MKKLLFFAVACFAMAACSDYDDSGLRNKIDDLDGKLSELEQQIADLQRKANKINDDIAAVQAIANGLSITSVTPTADGGYTVVFSDGQTYTISDGAKGDTGPAGDKGGDAQNPLFRIDAEGYWQISYDGTAWSYPNGQKISALGTPGESGPAGSAGAQGATPRLGVDSEGYWTVSYGGGTPERLTDAAGAPVKAVSGDTSASYDSIFSSVVISEDGATLDVVLAGSTDIISLPIGGKPLAQLLFDGTAVEGVQKFAYGESRAYTVEAAGADYMKVVGCPDGWKAVLAANTLTVTAPAAGTRATADSATDVSVMAVMKSGLSCIVRMQVEVDASSTPAQPVALAAPVLTAGASTESSVTVEWTIDAQAAGYVYKVGEAGAEQTLAKVASVTVADLAADTEYTLFVKAKGDGTATADSAWASIVVKTLAGGSPVEPTVQTLTLDAQAMSEAGLGLPTGKTGMTAGTVNTWKWDGVGFESYFALATSNNAAAVKVPVLYFYKAATAGTTTLRNTDALGEIVKITVTLIDNGSKKGSIFTMTANAGGAESAVLSSNDNTKAVEHVYTFPAGNNGMFSFANASAEDGKVVSMVIEYKK